jgi:hypothetical protein
LGGVQAWNAEAIFVRDFGGRLKNHPKLHEEKNEWRKRISAISMKCSA